MSFAEVMTSYSEYLNFKKKIAPNHIYGEFDNDAYEITDYELNAGWDKS